MRFSFSLSSFFRFDLYASRWFWTLFFAKNYTSTYTWIDIYGMCSSVCKLLLAFIAVLDVFQCLQALWLSSLPCRYYVIQCLQAFGCLHWSLIRLPSSAISLHLLRSLDRHDLFVPRARTSMVQTRTFAIIGPLLWNQLLHSMRSTLLTGKPSASFHSLKTALLSLGLSHWKRFWLVCSARSAI